MSLLKTLFGNYSKREVKRVRPICDKVLALDEKYKAFSEKELKAQTDILKKRLADGETLDDILPDAFAVCREVSSRVLGMKHFPVQIIGGIIVHQGRIAEMQTGEGKTLVVTLPCYLNALEGKGVHVVTCNDYLARRDAEQMGKVYRYLGMSVGVIAHDMDNEDRRAAYNADITYGTNNELGFDYLRDNMVTYKEDKVQREHNFAIVDEVDSILIDEARTPLIISGPGDKSTELYTIADNFAKTLKMEKVAELDEKEDNDELYQDADYIVDEKAKTATLTPRGIKKAEEFFHLDNLMDMENLNIQHHINQAIRARGVMQNEIDYVVKDGEVMIVDEFTGRIMAGRRYNEGLHQAIEAKEGVKVQRESKTLASVTFQNYFRLYKKLSGMTGTATTEEEEFNDIYKLDVVTIPTNKPVQRIDNPDSIFKTEHGKFLAIIRDIKACHEKGQPVLVGTISIDKSEALSKMLKKEGVRHAVLNAKYHDKEAEIIAQAGKKGAVTIATNMAGRGTDIKLGGNADFLAVAEMRRLNYSEDMINEAIGFNETDNPEIKAAREQYMQLLDKYEKHIAPEADEVRKSGGLFVMGTERHESRRIDNQLRGRSGRQGDPGETRFYLSGEDDLVRIFSGDRMKNMMERFKVAEDEPLDSKILSNVIESSQRKVEGRNYGFRKSVLQFDDVLNRQREIIYDQRDKVLEGEDLQDQIAKMIEQAIEERVKQYIPEGLSKKEWNIEGLYDHYMGWLFNEGDIEKSELRSMDESEITELFTNQAKSVYNAKEELIGFEMMRDLERFVLLKNVDAQWMDHIDAMEELKKGIRLRSYGQHDPVVEYRVEGFDMFDQMIANIRQDTAKMLLTIKVGADVPILKPERVKTEQLTTNKDDQSVHRTVKKGKKVGRNDPCPCGSGKKYKQCCGK